MIAISVLFTKKLLKFLRQLQRQKQNYRVLNSTYQNTKVCNAERPVSDAPTTTIRTFITTCKCNNNVIIFV